ncbi:MAG: membrane protein insertion efficiency factor YidD [Chlamydiae bacterium]|nr:membrane protein insertion efficiency factor YidD [Chlamydiota bacterium]
MIQWIFLRLIRLYQLASSPFFGSCCRFFPSCSEYAAECIQNKGAFKGSWLALKRILKCHPFHRGGSDFPPD